MRGQQRVSIEPRTQQFWWVSPLPACYRWARSLRTMRRVERRRRLRPPPGRLLVALLVAGSVIVLTGCGGSGAKPKTSTAPYGPKSSPAALSRCMRANGVSGFPDPEAGPNGAVGLPLIMGSDGSLTAEGKSFSGPALRKAERICAVYLPPASGPPPRIAAAEHRRELTQARCMRAHGVPNFPDPSSSVNSQPPSLAGIDTQSPAFKSAARACGAGGSGNFGFAG